MAIIVPDALESSFSPRLGVDFPRSQLTEMLKLNSTLLRDPVVLFFAPHWDRDWPLREAQKTGVWSLPMERNLPTGIGRIKIYPKMQAQ